MAIDINCDSCSGRVDRGENLYCQTCMDEKEGEITGLQSQVTDLEQEREELKEKLEDMERERGE